MYNPNPTKMQMAKQTAVRNAQTHGYKLAKMSAQGFIMASKAVFQQSVIVLKEIVRPGSSRKY